MCLKNLLTHDMHLCVRCASIYMEVLILLSPRFMQFPSVYSQTRWKKMIPFVKIISTTLCMICCFSHLKSGMLPFAFKHVHWTELPSTPNAASMYCDFLGRCRKAASCHEHFDVCSSFKYYPNCFSVVHSSTSWFIFKKAFPLTNFYIKLIYETESRADHSGWASVRGNGPFYHTLSTLKHTL